MADLEITVDFTSITQGEKTVVQLERQLDRLVKRFDNGAIEADAFRTGLIGLKREYAGLGVSIQKASGQVEKYVRATQRANAEQRKAADQKEWFANQRRRIRMMEESRRMEERQARESARIHSEGERAAKSHADELERLARRYRPLYAVSKLYEKELNDINRAHKEGVLNARQHASAVDLLNQEYQDFQNGVASATNRFRGSMVGSTRSLNDFGMATQQVGYQVGDFLVQVQSGTNVFVAFGQQATQLVGILPAFANSLRVSANTLAGISAGLGIVIPLVTALAAAFVRTREDADSASSGVGSLEDSIRTLKEETASAKLEIEAFNMGLSNTSEVAVINRIREVQVEIAELESQSGRSIRGRIANRKAELARLQDILDSARETREEQRRQADGIKNIIGLSQTQRNVTEAHIASMVELFEAARDLKEELGDAGFEALRLAGVDITEPISSAVKEAAVLAGKLDISLVTAYELNRADMSAGVMAAAIAAQELAKNLGISLQAALAMQGMLISRRTEDVFDPRDPRHDSDKFKNERTRRMMESGELYNTTIENTSGGGSSGGGGGGASGVGQDVFGFARQFMGEEDQAQVWYDQQLEKLQEFNEKELDILRRHGINKETIEQEYQNRVAGIRGQQNQAALGAYSQLFGNIATIAEAGGKKMVAVQKIAAVAQGLINAYLSYTNIMASPLAKSNPVLAKVLAVSSLAAGLAQVANIRATSYGSSGGGGGGRGASGGGASAAIATPQAASQAPQRVVIEGLDPSALYSGEMIQSIFDAIYDENEERGAVFMVAT